MGHLSCFKKLQKSKNVSNHKSSEGDERKRRGIQPCVCGDSSSKPEKKSTKKNPVKKRNKMNFSWCCTCCLTSENKRKFRCWKKKKDKKAKDANAASTCAMHLKPDICTDKPLTDEIIRIGNENIAAQVFTYKALAKSTQNFSSECLLGAGGFGKVYKGVLEDTNEVVAVKKLNNSICKESCRDFLLEVLMLSLLSHPNLVNLCGYCADGNERVLVYEYVPLGSLHDHLLDILPNRKPLDWITRMKIALGIAKGLEHLHDIASPPVIFGGLKSSNVLLDNDNNPRLVDFGFEKFGSITGTYGHCAPEFVLSGKLTVMSDIYSFGVVHLELITGRKAVDSTRPMDEQRLVDWAMPRFKDKKHLVKMADPSLQGNFPVKSLHQALAIAAMCIQEEDTTRPLIKDMVRVLQALAGHEMDNDDRVSNNDQHMTRNSFYFTDYGSVKSFWSDWQSCSTEREDEDDIKEEQTVAS